MALSGQFLTNLISVFLFSSYYNVSFNTSNGEQNWNKDESHTTLNTCPLVSFLMRSLPPHPVSTDSGTWIYNFPQSPVNSSSYCLEGITEFCCSSPATGEPLGKLQDFGSTMVISAVCSCNLWDLLLLEPVAHKGNCCPPSFPQDSPHPILWKQITNLQEEAKLSTLTVSFIQQKKWPTKTN